MKRFLHRFFEDLRNDGQKLRFSGLFLFGIAILAFLTLSGCSAMLTPGFGTCVDKTKPVLFTGGVSSPNAVITIQAYDGKNWIDIGTTTSDTKPYGPEPTYLWAQKFMIDVKYWGHKCATLGESALVRAKWAQGYLPSLYGDEGWEVQCWRDHPGSAFFSFCLSPETPNVHVGSLDYMEFGWQCTDIINVIRNIEGKLWLKEDVEGECTADDDAFCNFNNGPHHCNHPPQNDCSYAYPTIDGVFYDCLWKNMYLKEKTNYQKSPNTCYGAGGDNECGHYVNMVLDSRPTKVACGIYKTPDGKFYSIQNFSW